MNNNPQVFPNVAIVVIGYNRLDSIQRLLSSLLQADYPKQEIPLIISIDKSPSDKVSEYAQSFEWPYGTKHIVRHSQNLGLRKHVLQCGDFLKQYEAVIILEDDLLVSPRFYYFACQAVNKYSKNECIAGISLYTPAVSFYRNRTGMTYIL